MPRTLTVIYGHLGSGKHTLAHALAQLPDYAPPCTISTAEDEALARYLESYPDKHCVAVCDGFIPDANRVARQFCVTVFAIHSTKQTP